MNDLREFFTYVKLLALTMAVHSLYLQPLALGASTKESIELEKARNAGVELAKKYKGVSFYKFLQVNKDQLPVKAQKPLMGFFSKNQKVMFPEMRLEKALISGKEVTKIFLKAGNSNAVMEVFGEEENFFRINGIKFSYSEIQAFNPMLKKLEAMYKNDRNGNGLAKQRLPSSARENPIYVPLEDLAKAPRHLQKAYIKGTRDLVLALQDFQNLRTKGYKPQKTVFNSKTFLQDLLAPQAQATPNCSHQEPPPSHDGEGNSSDPCVIAGHISTYSQEGESTWSCGKKERATLQGSCSSGEVACEISIFGNSPNGSPFCASCPVDNPSGCLGATADCDRQAPLRGEMDFDNIFKSLRPQEASDPSRRIVFYEELMNAHQKAIAVCDGTSEGSLTTPNSEAYVTQCPDQGRACEVLKSRFAYLSSLSAKMTPPPVPPIKTECTPEESVKAGCKGNFVCFWNSIENKPECGIAPPYQCNPEQVKSCGDRQCQIKRQHPTSAVCLPECFCPEGASCGPIVPAVSTASDGPNWWLIGGIGAIITGLLAFCIFKWCKDNDKHGNKNSGGGGSGTTTGKGPELSTGDQSGDRPGAE